MTTTEDYVVPDVDDDKEKKEKERVAMNEHLQRKELTGLVDNIIEQQKK